MPPQSTVRPMGRASVPAVAADARAATSSRPAAVAQPVVRAAPSALFSAAISGEEAWIQSLLLQGGLDANVRDETRGGATALMLATQYRQMGCVETLLELGADPNASGAGRLAPIHIAAANGLGDAIRRLVDAGGDLDLRTDHECTAMHVAAQSEQDGIVRLLAELGADVDAYGHDGIRPLHTAVANDSLLCIGELLNAGASPLLATDAGSTPLHVAAQEGNSEAAKVLLDGCAEDVRELLVRARTKLDFSALHVAAQNGHATLVASLADAFPGAIHLHSSKVAWTPLHSAVRHNQLAVIDVLLRENANVDALSAENTTPLHLAAQYDLGDAAAKLLAAGARPTIVDKLLGTAVHVAAAMNSCSVLRKLVNHRNAVNINARAGAAARTPLHEATDRASHEAMRILLSAGAQCDVRQSDTGWAPLVLAARRNDAVACKMLLDAGASVDLRSLTGWTALHAAIHVAAIDAVLALLDAGADANLVSGNGNTPLMMAVLHINPVMRTRLLARLLAVDGIELHTRNGYGDSAVDIAFRAHHLDAAEALLRAEDADADDLSPLHRFQIAAAHHVRATCSAEAAAKHAMPPATPVEEGIDHHGLRYIIKIDREHPFESVRDMLLGDVRVLMEEQQLGVRFVENNEVAGVRSGLMKELVSVLARDVFADEAAWRTCDDGRLHVDDVQTRDGCARLAVAGRMLGIALLLGISPCISLSTPLLDAMLGRADWDREEALAEIDASLDVSMTRATQEPHIYLAHVADEVDVDNAAAVDEYVHAYRKRVVHPPAVCAFLRAVHEMLPASVLAKIGDRDALDSMLVGTTLNVDEWQEHTVYDGFDETRRPADAAFIKLFWDVVRNDLDDDERAGLFHFATAVRRLPVGGIAALPQGFRLVKSPPSFENALPRAFTCANALIVQAEMRRSKLVEGLRAVARSDLAFTM